MFIQIFRFFLSFTLFLGVAACGGNEADDATDTEKQAALDGRVECALAGSANFERTCATERITSDAGQILIIRHADGGFRRFKILTDGRGLAPADGYDETNISLIGNGVIEVSSGDDKYRLPAQIKGGEAQASEDAG